MLETSDARQAARLAADPYPSKTTSTKLEESSSEAPAITPSLKNFTIRDRYKQSAKALYPDITPSDDAELIILGGGTFKGTPSEFPAYMVQALHQGVKHLKPEDVPRGMKMQYSEFKKMLDAPYRPIGVSGLCSGMRLLSGSRHVR